MRINKLLPHNYQYFIAGGFAVCPSLAQDIDVFVRCLPGEALETRSEILKYLEDRGYTFEEEKNADPTIVRIHDGYDYLSLRILKVAKVPYEFSEPVHLLVTDAPINDVLNSFDLSICQIALTPSGIEVGDEWTAPNEPIRIVKMTPTTPERLAKYQQRFKLYTQNTETVTN